MQLFHSPHQHTLSQIVQSGVLAGKERGKAGMCLAPDSAWTGSSSLCSLMQSHMIWLRRGRTHRPTQKHTRAHTYTHTHAHTHTYTHRHTLADTLTDTTFTFYI